MSYQIANCPHCDWEGTVKIIQTPFAHGWVGCPKCKIYKNWQHSPKEAIEIWNRRVPESIGGYLHRWEAEKEI